MAIGGLRGQAGLFKHGKEWIIYRKSLTESSIDWECQAVIDDQNLEAFKNIRRPSEWMMRGEPGNCDLGYRHREQVEFRMEDGWVQLMKSRGRDKMGCVAEEGRKRAEESDKTGVSIPRPGNDSRGASHSNSSDCVSCDNQNPNSETRSDHSASIGTNSNYVNPSYSDFLRLLD